MKVGLQHLVQKDVYAECLRRLDARALLEHYGALNCSEQPGGDGTTEIVHSCLLDRVEPHHANGDSHPSAALNVEKKVYCCYALGWGGDLFHLIAKLEGTKVFGDTLSTVGRFLSGATAEASQVRDELEKIFAHSNAYSIELPAYSERILDSWATPHPYWAQRGVSEQTRATLKLGYDERENRIVFPHFVDATLVGWQKRVIPPGGEWVPTFPDTPKYRNSSGLPKSETLYNLDTARCHTRVCVVESPMSVARAVSLGIPNVVSTFGAKVSTQQIDQLKDFEVVYVWFDRDVAGINGERKLMEGLYRHTDVQVVTPDKGRDLANCDAAEIAVKLKHTTPAALKLGLGDSYRRLH